MKVQMFNKTIKNQKKIDSKIVFFVVCSIVVLLVLLVLDINYIESWEGILVEAHGLLFDIILFGVILAIYDFKRKKRDKIESLKEELDDYRYWKSEEAMRKNVGIIKRLTKLGITVIDLSHSFLEGADLKNLNLSGSKMYWTYLKKANIEYCNFSNVNLSWAEMQGSNIVDSNLSKSDLSCTLLSEAFIIRSNFTDTLLTNTKLSDVRVHDLDFLKILKNNKGFETINNIFYVDNKPNTPLLGGHPYYIIKRRK